MSKIRRAVTVGAVAAALSAGAIAITSGSAVADQWDPCDLSVKVNELKEWDQNGEYNIMVWKAGAYDSANFKGVVINDGEEHDACGNVGERSEYHWVVFKSGEFTRKGDGGYRNWAFYGTWDRPSDTHVIFKEP